MKDLSAIRAPQIGGAASEQSSHGEGFRGWLRKMFRHKNGAETLRDTIEELIEQEDSVEQAGGDELVFLRNILNLRNLTARDVMIPRADIVAVDVGISLPDLVELIGGKAHSRMPVFRDTLDDVIGMVHIKDVMAYRSDSANFKLPEIARRLLFVAPTMPILELLLQMRARRTHMALVVDEFGGVDGLITIEDLVEEIVGEIEDEHDTDDPPDLVERPDGSFEIDARLPIPDFEQRVGSMLTDEERVNDIDTMGGLVFAIAGRVPGRGEVILHDTGIEFEVLEADPRRIKRLRVSGFPQNADNE
jgi:CBS domain containing-hemolysin-like protein